MKKFMILFLLGLFVLTNFNGCSKVEDFMWDEISPTPIPGNSGLIIASNVTALGVDLHWTKATDDITHSTNLEYLVYYSTTTNLDTVSNVEADGIAVGSYTNDIKMKSVTGLSENSTYSFTVIVKDGVTNKAAYKVKVVNTPEGRNPIAGNNGVITVNNVGDRSLVLNWTKALDNVSSQANLAYLVYYSTNANMNSVADIEVNGTAVGSYEKDITSREVTDLNTVTTNYFNVIVKDEAGNKSIYDVEAILLYPLFYNGNGNASGLVPAISYYTNGQVVTVVGNSGNLIKSQDGISLDFIGWTKGSGTFYTNGSVFSIGSTPITLYAIWGYGDAFNLSLRSNGPAGGLIFYDKGSYSDGWRYLEADPNQTVLSWTINWGTYIFSAPGADGTAIGTGQQNSLDIIAGDSFANKAADECANFSKTNDAITYDDWFLPSKDELNKMYLNLRSGTDENGVVYAEVGGFIDYHYWSSSECNDNDAWLQYFGGLELGDQRSRPKYFTSGVRAVRTF